MKNCVINLDIIIIRNNVIVNIRHNCPPCRGTECPSYGGNGNIVLELEGGTCGYYNTGYPKINNYALFCVSNKNYTKNWESY